MNYYSHEIRKVLCGDDESLNIQISSSTNETQTLRIPKKYIIALYNELLIGGVE